MLNFANLLTNTNDNWFLKEVELVLQATGGVDVHNEPISNPATLTISSTQEYADTVYFYIGKRRRGFKQKSNKLIWALTACAVRRGRRSAEQGWDFTDIVSLLSDSALFANTNRNTRLPPLIHRNQPCTAALQKPGLALGDHTVSHPPNCGSAWPIYVNKDESIFRWGGVVPRF